MTRTLAAVVAIVVVAAMSVPAHGQRSLDMSGTWELVREKSSPQPPGLCHANELVAGLKGETCYPAMPQIIVEEATDHFTVTGYVPFLPYVSGLAPDPASVAPGVVLTPLASGGTPLAIRSNDATVIRATVSLHDAFTRLGTIDGTVVWAIRSKDAVVVRVYLPQQYDNFWCGPSGSDSFGGPPFGVESRRTEFFDTTRPGRAVQCIENRFVLDPSGELTIRSGWVYEGFDTHVQQVFRRVR